MFQRTRLVMTLVALSFAILIVPSEGLIGRMIFEELEKLAYKVRARRRLMMS